MAQTVGNVSTGKPGASGGVYTAPLGTTLPTDSTTALAAAYTALGYVSEDGVTNSNSPETDTGKAWGGDIVITYQTEKPDTFQFALIESLNSDVLKAVYGSSHVTGSLSAGMTVTATSDEAEAKVWVIEVVMRDNTFKRIVVPNARIIEVGDIVYKDDEIVAYDVTLQAFPDNSIGGTHKEFIKKITASS